MRAPRKKTPASTPFRLGGTIHFDRAAVNVVDVLPIHRTTSRAIFLGFFERVVSKFLVAEIDNALLGDL